MRRAAALLLAVLPCVRGQLTADPSTAAGRELIKRFESYWREPGKGTLACGVSHYDPSLDFGLRMWSGFRVTLPARQFPLEKRESIAIVFRVRPEAAPDRSRVFAMALTLPPFPAGQSPEKVWLNTGGGFLAGRGRYAVELVVLDARDRRCRAGWKIAVNRTDAELRTPPDTVETADAGNWEGFPAGAGAKPSRVTIFLNAAPVWPRRYVSRLSPRDRQILLSSLSSVLRNTQFTSACVVVYDLMRRETIYRDTAFDRASLRSLARQMLSVDLSTIPMSVLEKGDSPQAFLEGLLRRETREPAQSDAFLFIGSAWRAGPKLRPLPEDLREALPRTYSLSFSTPDNVDSDSVSSLVRSAKGRVFRVGQPSDLFSAIRAIAAGR